MELTELEEKIFKLKQEGLSQRQIAEKLDITFSQVKYNMLKLRKAGIIKKEETIDYEARKKEIIKLYQEGLSIKKIAEIVGMDLDYLRVYIYGLKKKGLIINPKDIIFEKQNEQIRELRKQGIYTREIAERLGMKKPTVEARIRKMIEKGELKDYGNTRPKTSIQNNQIIEYSKQGLSYAEIAEKVNLAESYVGKIVCRFRKKGVLDNPNEPVHYTANYDRKLIKLHEQGLTQQEIADELIITKSAVNNRIVKMRKMGKMEPAMPQQHKAHTLERYEKIIEMFNNGFTNDEIAREVGFKTRSIKNVLYNLRKEGKLPAVNRKVKKPETIQQNLEIAELIKEHISIEEIAVRYNISESTVQKRLKWLRDEGYLPPYKPAKKIFRQGITLEQRRREAQEAGYRKKDVHYLLNLYMKEKDYWQCICLLDDYSRCHTLKEEEVTQIKQVRKKLKRLMYFEQSKDNQKIEEEREIL